MYVDQLLARGFFTDSDNRKYLTETLDLRSVSNIYFKPIPKHPLNLYLKTQLTTSFVQEKADSLVNLQREENDTNEGYKS